jgi:hypothetical protein
MSGSKHAHLRKSYKAGNLIPFLLAAICLVGCLNADMPVNAAESGIRGTALWGPVKPGPSRLGQSDEEPFRATFIVLVDERQVAQFKSDKKGNFEVLLPAGDYTIVPDKSTPIPAPQNQMKIVTVPEDGFAVVTLRFDTGMR